MYFALSSTTVGMSISKPIAITPAVTDGIVMAAITAPLPALDKDCVALGCVTILDVLVVYRDCVAVLLACAAISEGCVDVLVVYKGCVAVLICEGCGTVLAVCEAVLNLVLVVCKGSVACEGCTVVLVVRGCVAVLVVCGGRVDILIYEVV